MEDTLIKKKRGRPIKHDFSGLQIGESVPFKGSAKANPNQYVAYWNRNKEVQIEIVWTKRGVPYARRIS